jgi:hypothetical protein
VPYDPAYSARKAVELYLRQRPGRFYCRRCLTKIAAAVAMNQLDSERGVDALFLEPDPFARMRNYVCDGCQSKGARAIGVATSVSAALI